MEESTSGVQWLISVEMEVSDGRWHDVQIRKAGQNVTVAVDNNAMFEELGILPSPLRTTSHLYIGGLPSGYMYMFLYREVSSHHMQESLVCTVVTKL